MAVMTDKFVLFSIFFTVSVFKFASSTYSCNERGDLIQVDVEDYQVCDFIPDCANEADESSCGVDCSFEDNGCGWESVDVNGWSLESADSISGSLTGPTVDRTNGTSAGGFFLALQTASNPVSSTRLTSPSLHNTADGCKLSFFYHLGRDDAWQLQVFLTTGNATTHLISNLGSKSTGSKQWRKKFVNVGRAMGPLQLVIEAKVINRTPNAAVAIDGVKFVDCGLAVHEDRNCTEDTEWQCDNGGCIRSEQLCDYVQDCRDNSDETQAICESRRRCNAEVDFCNFTNSETLEWQRLTPASNSEDSDWPVTDHTLLTAAGSVFAVGQEGSALSRAVLVGPYLAGVDPAKEPCKMTLYYYIHGVNPGKLQIGFKTRYSDVETLTLSMAKSSEETWKKASYKFTSTADFQPLILATLEEGGSRSGVVAVDDIIFSESCLDAKLETIYDLCTFEDGSSTCPWTNDDDRPLQWSVIQGSEAGQNMALRRDHTTQDLSGQYLYLDSMPGHEGLSARYLSKVFRPGSCELVLWYYLGGSNADKLSIYTRQTIEGSLQLEWRKFSDGSRPSWKAAVVTFEQTSNFQIVIEGSAGSFTTSADHVGIDDMGFRVACDVAENAVLPQRREIHDQGRCENNEYSCSDNTCQPKKLFCDTKADCADESDEAKCPMQCNFDDGLCHWTNDVLAGNSWINGTTYNKYGIKKDHTSKSAATGLFLYIDVHDLPAYQSAQLVSPKWTLPPQQCRVSVWYYRFGANYGSLSIKLRQDGESDMDLLTLASSLGNFNQWLEVSAPIPNCIATAQILLTAQNSFGNLQHGGYAIDDVSLECDNTCSDHQCSDGGFCYTSSQKCDLTVDCCLDESDEEHCDMYNTCSFDHGLCVWVQDDHMPWTRHDGVMKRATVEEHDDIPNGDGAFVEAHFMKNSKGHKSTLHSYVIQPTTGVTCQLRFSFFVQSSTMLTVFIRHLDEEPEDHIWQNSGTDSWKKAEVTLSSDEPFKVMIEASSTSNKEGHVGFDSSSFTPSCNIAKEETPQEVNGKHSGIIICLVILLLIGCLLVICFVLFKKKRSGSAALKVHSPRSEFDEEADNTETVKLEQSKMMDP